MITPEWVIAARGLKSERDALPTEGGRWERIAAGWPPVLEGDGVRGLVAPLVAAVAWAGAYLRELAVMSDPEGSAALDPFAMFMRLLAFGLTVRALILGGELVRRLRVASARRRSYLVLAPKGIYARLPDGEGWLEKDEIIAVLEPGHWQGRRGGRRFTPVYVVPARGRVGGRDAPFLSLPPMFLETSGVLAEHLGRWRGAIEEPEAVSHPEPETLGSKLYDDAASGVLFQNGGRGCIAVQHGSAWLRAGPYASLFLAVAATDGYLRASPSERALLGPWPAVVVGVVALLVPLVWIWMTRREIAPRRGLAMLMTPAEVMFRTRAGVLRTKWSSLLKTIIDQKVGWSVLQGIHKRNILVLKRKNMEPVYYEEAFMGVPSEVAQAWMDAYRRGILPLSNAS